MVNPDLVASIAGRIGVVIIAVCFIWLHVRAFRDGAFADPVLAITGVSTCYYAIARWGKAKVPLLGVAGGLLMVAPAVYLCPEPDHIRVTLARFVEDEHRILTSFDDALRRHRRGELTDEELANLVSNKILPAWAAAASPVHGLQHVPAEKEELIAVCAAYAEARQSALEALVEASRGGDPAKQVEWEEKWHAANQLVKRLNEQSAR